ncbi:hypothetical protein L9F63_014441, partial [Diploptera punctata]
IHIRFWHTVYWLLRKIADRTNFLLSGTLTFLLDVFFLVESMKTLNRKRRSLLRNYLTRCRTLKTSIMFSVYVEKRNLIESTKEFNWKNRRIGVILHDADVVVYEFWLLYFAFYIPVQNIYEGTDLRAIWWPTEEFPNQSSFFITGHVQLLQIFRLQFFHFCWFLLNYLSSICTTYLIESEVK